MCWIDRLSLFDLRILFGLLLQVDDKYQYSIENKDNRVHGWISTEPPVGFWQITPSQEFKSGGPFKQCLTSHVGPTTLAVSTLLFLHFYFKANLTPAF